MGWWWARDGLVLGSVGSGLFVDASPRQAVLHRDVQLTPAAGAAARRCAGLINLFNTVPKRREGVIAPRFEGTIEFLAHSRIDKLMTLRCERLAELETTFPTVHWMVLGLLGAPFG